MNLDILTSKAVKYEKAWGFELWLANNEEHNYCGKILHINKGQRFSMHFHALKHETFFLLLGKVRLEVINTETAQTMSCELEPGATFEVPRFLPHRIEALEDSDIIESSTFHRNSDSYRVYRD